MLQQVHFEHKLQLEIGGFFFSTQEVNLKLPVYVTKANETSKDEDRRRPIGFVMYTGSKFKMKHQLTQLSALLDGATAF